MTAQQQAFDARVEEKIEKMMPYLVKLSGGDPDLVQEGRIGIWEAMSKEPDASDVYHRTKAKWNILQQINGVGKSVDIPKKAYKRKWPISIDHYDAGHDENADLHQSLLADRRRVPLDEWVIQKVDFRKFLDTLTTSEYGYIHLKMMEGMPDAGAADRMDISLQRLRQMKKAIRIKVEDFYEV